MPAKRPVIAAVCHYNMVDTLKKLLRQLEEQNYDRIYVLDDASTDPEIKSLASEFPKVEFIFGEENRGSAGNRNRILDLDVKPTPNTLVHFLDADVSILSQDTPEAIRQIFKENGNQLVGGLINFPNGKQEMFNYGPERSVYCVIGGMQVGKLNRLYKKSPKKAEKYYNRRKYFLKDWPNILEEPTRRPIFWMGEANIVAPYSIFEKVNGFNAKLHYHEIQDLAIRLEKINVPRYFDERVAVEHPYFYFDKSRMKSQFIADVQLLFKYGLRLK